MTKFENRNEYIGGSDFATVLNISPYGKRINLVLEKAGVIASTFEGNEATRRGEKLEDSVIELFEKETKLKVTDKQAIFEYQPDFGLKLLCHVDGLTSDNCLFEAKTTDIAAKTWKNGIPDHYKAQLEFNCFLAKKKKAYIAVAYCKECEIIKFEYFEYIPKMSKTDILLHCNLFSSDVEKYKELGIINSGLIVESPINNSDIDELLSLTEKISLINKKLMPLENKKKIIEEKLKKLISNNAGIENELYRITLGNRVTSPIEDYKVCRSGLKIELK